MTPTTNTAHGRARSLMNIGEHQLQLTLARSRRDAGVELSSNNAGDEWTAEATAFLKRYLETHSTMHVDLLWDAGLTVPKSSRGLGAVIKHAVKQKWIEPITSANGYVAALPSTRSNMQLKPVWRSNLYNQATSNQT